MLYPKVFTGAILLATSLSSALFATYASARVLNETVSGELASFDTSQVLGGDWELQILRDVYEGLLTESADSKLIPGMATSWDISRDGLTYTFHLRPDAKWSDGTPVTADDFIFGWQHVLDPKSASEYAYMLYPIAHAQQVNLGKEPLNQLGVRSLDGGKTLEVKLSEPMPYFLKMLAFYAYYPQPRHLYDKYGKDWVKMGHIATNGAFKPVEWVSHSHILTKKNTNYYDAANVSLEGVKYYDAEDKNAAVNRFRAREFDISSYPTSSHEWLKKTLPEATHQAPTLATYYYAFNSQKERPTADVRVREALTLAIRRDVLAKNITKGSFLAADAFIPPGFDGYRPQAPDTASEPYPQRLAKARKLLQEAGYSDAKPLTLNLRFNTSEDNRRIAVAIAAMWKALGVKVNMVTAEAAVHYAALAQNDFDIGRAGWGAEYNDPEDFIQLLKSGVSKNYGSYSNPEYDKLVDEEHQAKDTTDRYRYMEQAEKLAMNDYAILPLLTYTSQTLVNPDLKGWEDNPMDHHPARWISFKK